MNIWDTLEMYHLTLVYDATMNFDIATYCNLTVSSKVHILDMGNKWLQNIKKKTVSVTDLPLPLVGGDLSLLGEVRLVAHQHDDHVRAALRSHVVDPFTRLETDKNVKTRVGPNIRRGRIIRPDIRHPVRKTRSGPTLVMLNHIQILIMSKIFGRYLTVIW